MKKIKLLILCLLIHFLGTSQSSSDSFQNAQSTKKANLTYVYEGIDGFSTKTEAGDYKGLLVDVIRQFELFVQQKHGITISSRFVAVENDFQGYLKHVSNSKGGVFGISPASIKAERKKIMQFSTAYLNNISVLITNKSVPTLASMSEISSKFNSMKVYTVPSTTFADRVNGLKKGSFQSLEIVNVPSMYEMVDKIAGDKASFGFVDLNYYFDYLQKGSPLKRHPSGDLKGDEWGIIMPLDSDWKPIIDDFFNSGFRKSAEYRQMVIQNLGRWALRMVE